MRTALIASICLVSILSSNATAQLRTWQDVYGNSLSGTIHKFNNQRVSIRNRTRNVSLHFWELMPAHQEFVNSWLKQRGQSEDVQDVSDVPRDWTIATGRKTQAQFLKVESDGQISLVEKGVKKKFKFAEFTQTDQGYIRKVLTAQGKGNLVPANPSGLPNSPIRNSPIPNSAVPTGGPYIPNPAVQNANDAALRAKQRLEAMQQQQQQRLEKLRTQQQQKPLTLPDNLPQEMKDAVAKLNRDTARITGEPTTGFSNNSPNNPNPGGYVPQTPEINIPAMPQITTPNIPSMRNRDYYECSSCKREVSASATRCPHCRVQFDYVEEADGTRRNISGRSVGAGIAIFIVCGTISFFLRKLTN